MTARSGMPALAPGPAIGEGPDPHSLAPGQHRQGRQQARIHLASLELGPRGWRELNPQTDGQLAAWDFTAKLADLADRINQTNTIKCQMSLVMAASENGTV